MLGLLSDSHGDLQAFDAAYELLKRQGAKRFVFVGGRYEDLDEWTLLRKERARGGRAYADADFLADITNFLSARSQIPRPPAFDDDAKPPVEDFERVKERFVRTPERDCLQYRDPLVPKKAMEMMGDVLCCAVHDKNDLDREDLQNALVFFHGKQPEPRVVQIGPRIFFTPGRLVGAAEQTCGLVELQERSLCFTAFGLDGKVILDHERVALAGRTKLSVK